MSKCQNVEMSKCRNVEMSKRQNNHFPCVSIFWYGGFMGLKFIEMSKCLHVEESNSLFLFIHNKSDRLN